MSQTEFKPKPSIWYAGVECFFEEPEIDSIDEAQALIDHYRRLGYKACCLHGNGKHQLYVEPLKKKR